MVKGHCGVGTLTVDMNPNIPNITGNSSGPSSLVTDANSALTVDPQLQRNTSFNSESYGRVPASPQSFTSVMDSSTILQQSPQQGAAATSQLTEQDLSNGLNVLKKARVGMRQEEIVPQHLIQQILQRQDSMQNLLQQNRPQQIAQSYSPMQRASGPIGFQQQQQIRHNLLQQTMQPVTPVKRSSDNAICSRRLMQYLYHQRHRPVDNPISYWRKFVAEYFAPRAKERWCLSMYDSIGKHALGAFPQPSTDAWQCDICGSECGKGFEATFDVLPRLCQIKFDHGVVDENLFLGMPHESRLPTGVMILEYKKAVQESVYKHLRVVREGTLRIMFTPELKMFRWDFCAQKHEEFLPRRVLAPQVNELLQVAQKYQNAVGNENGSSALSLHDLQASCNMFLAAGRQVARDMELQSINDLGFSKRYVRCLQISEVVSSMKDLIEFSREHKIGPVESLKDYTRQATAKLQKQRMEETEQMVPPPNLSDDQNILSKVLGIPSERSSQLNNDLAASHFLNANQKSMFARNNYQNLLRNSLTPNLNQNQNILPQEVSSTSSSVKQGQSMQFQGSASLITPNSFVNDTCPQYQQQPKFIGCLPQQNNIHPSQVNQHMQQHAIQQMLQEMINNKRGATRPLPSTSNANGYLASSDATDISTNAMLDKIDSGPGKDSSEMHSSFTGVLNNTVGPVQTNNFTSGNPNITSNIISSKPDLADSLDLPDFDHIVQEFAENGMFDSVGESGDIECFWKA